MTLSHWYLSGKQVEYSMCASTRSWYLSGKQVEYSMCASTRSCELVLCYHGKYEIFDKNTVFTNRAI